MAEHLTFVIHEVVRLMDQAADRILEHELGISFALAEPLMALRTEQPCSQRHLAEMLRLTPAAITRSLPALIEDGFVFSVVDPKQPRRNLVSLTAKGQILADRSWEVLEKSFLGLLKFAGVEHDDFFQMQVAIRNSLRGKKGKE